MYALQKKGLIRKGNAEGEYVATMLGIKATEFDQLTITPRKWDGKWRLFMFDIPESIKTSRVSLSRKVLEMGMKSFQKSVFISPYPCEDELRKAVRFLRVEKYIRLVIASEISDEDRFKKMFGL
jgi:DNA-binding transcriptional regulator PaaX